MKKHYISIPPAILGMYITDNSTLAHHKGAESYWIEHKNFTYLPILKLLTLSSNCEVRLASGESIQNDITSYNENYVLSKMDEKTVQRSKLNLTFNDLLMNDIDIGLNFTGKRVTVYNDKGRPKSFAPLKLEPLNEYQGKFLILTVSTFNSIETMHKVYGLTNYIKQLRDKVINRKDAVALEAKMQYDYILDCIANKKVGDVMSTSETYKVATITVVDIDSIINNIDPGIGVVHLLNKKYELSFYEILSAPEPDVLKHNYMQNPVLLESFRGNGFSCSIVDNHDRVADRYINFGGKVKKVEKVKDPNRVCGVYTVDIDASKNINHDNFIPLEEIDSANFLYKSVEEAQRGANIKEIYKDEVELRKLEQVNESIEIKAEHEANLHQLKLMLHESEMRRLKEKEEHERQQRERDAQWEERKRKSDAEYEERMRAIKLESEKIVTDLKLKAESRRDSVEDHKFYYDRNRWSMDNQSLYVKRDYEYAKYERDSTVETIKTVGAVAGLLAGGYALYSKFSSK